MRFLCAAVLFVATSVAASLHLTPAQAATVNVDYDMALAYQTRNGVRANTATYSTDLIGALIEAVYTDGTSESWNWVRRSQWRGGTDHVSADMTLDYKWWGFEMQANKRVQSLAVNLAPAGVIWDAGIYPEGDARNTVTTRGGQPFHIAEGGDSLNGSVNATYSGLVQVKGQPIGEDAFTNLRIDFSGLEGHGLLGAITWGMDMDVLASQSDLTPVPLPASLLLLLGAMGTFAAIRAIPRRAGTEGGLAA